MLLSYTFSIYLYSASAHCWSRGTLRFLQSDALDSSDISLIILIPLIFSILRSSCWTMYDTVKYVVHWMHTVVTNWWWWWDDDDDVWRRSKSRRLASSNARRGIKKESKPFKKQLLFHSIMHADWYIKNT